jgi:hypothetical protein
MRGDDEGGQPPVPRWVAGTAVAGTVLIALGAFWLSFTALADLAIRAGIPGNQAWVWPLIVDGIILVATLSVVALAPQGRRATWYPWTLLVVGAGLSVTGNAIHAVVASDASLASWMAATISAVPPLVLLSITHLTVVLTTQVAAPPPRADAPTHLTSDEDTPAAAADPARSRDDRMAEAQARRADGWSNRRIARHLRVHPSTVGRWLREDTP